MTRDPNFEPDLPRVQLPVGTKKPGLSIDGDFVHYIDLPEKAKRAYDRFTKFKNRVRQCENCGYLTMSENTNKHNGYKCANCGRRNFRLVYGGVTSENEIDPSDLDPEEYPNTKSHLSRIENEIEKSLPMKEMLYKVAKAVKRQRNPLRRAVDEVTRGKTEQSQVNLDDFMDGKPSR